MFIFGGKKIKALRAFYTRRVNHSKPSFEIKSAEYAAKWGGFVLNLNKLTPEGRVFQTDAIAVGTEQELNQLISEIKGA